MRTLRVLHLAPGPGVGSGIAAYAGLFREALSACGVEVRTLDTDLYRLNTKSGIRDYVRRALRAQVDFGPDIVHVELGGGALGQFWAARALARPGAPVVATIHDAPRPVWWPWHFHALRHGRMISGAIRRLTDARALAIERQLLSDLEHSFTLTAAGADSVRTLLGRSSVGKVPTVLPYPQRPRLTGVPRSADDGTFRIGFHGYWYPGKQLDLVVHAAAVLAGRHDGVRLTLGGGPSESAGRKEGDHLLREVHALVDRLGIGRITSFPGFLPEADLHRFLATTDVIVLPYAPAKFGNHEVRSTSAAMHDALACATPVIAADTKALSEHLRSGVNGLLYTPGCGPALTGLLESLFTDPGLRERLQAGARQAGLRYSLEACGRAAVAAYGQIAARA